MAGGFGRILAAAVVLLCAAVAASPPAGPARRWRVDLAARGEPAVAMAAVTFLTPHHEVVSLDAATGAVRWRAPTREPGASTLGSRVVAHGDVVLAGDYNVVGFDQATGAFRWRFSPADGYGAGVYLGEAAGGVVFAGSPAARLYAVRVGDGSLAWSTPPVAEGAATVFEPMTDGSIVAAGYTAFGSPVAGGVVVLDAWSGHERWRRPFPTVSADGGTGFAGGPVLAHDVLIVSSGDGFIYGFDIETGAVRWRLPPVRRRDGTRQPRDWRALALDGNTLIAGSASGTVSAWDLTTREERWTYVHADAGSTAMRLLACGGRVYVPHLSGRLVAIDVRTGRPVWQTGGTDEGFSWIPAVSGGVVYAAARAGFFALAADR